MPSSLLSHIFLLINSDKDTSLHDEKEALASEAICEVNVTYLARSYKVLSTQNLSSWDVILSENTLEHSCAHKETRYFYQLSGGVSTVVAHILLKTVSTG